MTRGRPLNSRRCAAVVQVVEAKDGTNIEVRCPTHTRDRSGYCHEHRPRPKR